MGTLLIRVMPSVALQSFSIRSTYHWALAAILMRIFSCSPEWQVGCANVPKPDEVARPEAPNSSFRTTTVYFVGRAFRATRLDYATFLELPWSLKSLNRFFCFNFPLVERNRHEKVSFQLQLLLRSKKHVSNHRSFATREFGTRKAVIPVHQKYTDQETIEEFSLHVSFGTKKSIGPQQIEKEKRLRHSRRRLARNRKEERKGITGSL